MQKGLHVLSLLTVALSVATSAHAADVYGLEVGTPDLQSIGPLAFGPDGILFAGDNKGAAVFALKTGDNSGDASKAKHNISDVNAKVASALGTKAENVNITDMVVNPLSGNLYISVMAGEKPALVRIDSQDKASPVVLEGIAFAKVAIPNAPEDKPTRERRAPKRSETITDLAFADGYVLVSGVAAKESPSAIRSIQFPFDAANEGASLEIFHGNHGRLEDYSPIRTFIPIMIGGEPNVLAGFTCTPLVKFPVNNIAPKETVRGTTVAELGNRNVPLDMIAYKKDGKDYLLLANSARGVMKVSTANLDRQDGITSKVEEETAGQPYETIDALDGTIQLDRLNDTSAVVIQKEGDTLNLKTIPLP